MNKKELLEKASDVTTSQKELNNIYTISNGIIKNPGNKNEMAYAIEIIRSVANNISTPSGTLKNIYDSYKKDSSIVEAVGLNPNTGIDTIRTIFISEYGMADKIIDTKDGNATFQLLMLENPNLLKEWIQISAVAIFFSNNNKHPLLLEAVYQTNDPIVFAELAKHPNATKDMINKIENYIINKLNSCKDSITGATASMYLQYYERQITSIIIDTEHLSGKFAAFVQDNNDVYDLDTVTKLYAKIYSSPTLNQEIADFRILNATPINKEKQKLINKFNKCIPYAFKIIEGVQFKRDMGDKYENANNYCHPGGTKVQTNFQYTDITAVSYYNVPLFAYNKNNDLIYINTIRENDLVKFSISADSAMEFKNGYLAAFNENTPGADLTQFYNKYLKGLNNYEPNEHLEKVNDAISTNPNTEIDVLQKIFTHNNSSGAIDAVLAHPNTQAALEKNPNLIDEWVSSINQAAFENPIPIKIQQKIIKIANDDRINCLARSKYAEPDILTELINHKNTLIKVSIILNSNLKVSDLVSIINNDESNVIREEVAIALTRDEELSNKFDAMRREDNQSNLESIEWNNSLYNTIIQVRQNTDSQQTNYAERGVMDGAEYQIKIEAYYIKSAKYPDDPRNELYTIISKDAKKPIAAFTNGIAVYNNMNKADATKWKNIQQNVALYNAVVL